VVCYLSNEEFSPTSHISVFALFVFFFLEVELASIPEDLEEELKTGRALIG
jgi:hypothetical protein